MNNINQKNIIQKLLPKAQMPYLCADFISLYEACENANSIEMNNIAQQLLDNDLYLEASLNDASSYVVGPKIYDETNIAQMPNGYKAYGDIKTADCLDILRKVNDPLSSTLRNVYNQAATFICQYGSKIFAATASKLLVSEDPSSKEFTEVKTITNGSVAGATNWYEENENLFFCTSNNAYQLSSAYVLNSHTGMMEEKSALVPLLKNAVNSSYGTVNAIAVSLNRGQIALATEEGKVLAGAYPKNGDVDIAKNSIVLEAQTVQKSGSANPKCKSLHYYPDSKISTLYVGADDGLYQETLSAGFEGLQQISKSAAGGSQFCTMRWFNGKLYVGAQNGLWILNSNNTLSRPNCSTLASTDTSLTSNPIVSIVTTGNDMFVATSSNIYKITPSYIVNQTKMISTSNTILTGKNISSIDVSDGIVLIGTDNGVFYYTQNDVIYPFKLADVAGVVGVVLNRYFVAAATQTQVYLYQILDKYFLDTTIIKNMKSHLRAGIATDGEVKKIFELGGKTFVASSSKIFSLDNTIIWSRPSFSISNVEAFTFNDRKFIAVAGSSSIVLELNGNSLYQSSIEAVEGTSFSSIDVAFANGILVFIKQNTSSSKTNVLVADLNGKFETELAENVELNGLLTQIESVGDTFYGQSSTGNCISSIVKFQTATRSTECNVTNVNAFAVEDDNYYGFIATDSGMSCIVPNDDYEEDGDATVDFDCAWVAGKFTSLAIVNYPDTGNTLLAGKDTGIYKISLDGLQPTSTAIASAVGSSAKMSGSPSNSTSIVSLKSNSGDMRIFAAASNKLYVQRSSWQRTGSTQAYGTNLKVFCEGIYFNEGSETEQKQQLFSNSNGTYYIRGSETEEIVLKEASKIIDAPVGFYIVFTDGSLGFFYDYPDATGYDVPTYASLTNSTAVIDAMCYQYSGEYGSESNFLGTQFILHSNGLYRRNDASFDGTAIVYSLTTAESLVKTFYNPTNCDLFVQDLGDHSGKILVAQSNGTIYIADIDFSAVPSNWTHATVPGVQIKKAWLVGDDKIVVWTTTNQLNLYSIYLDNVGSIFFQLTKNLCNASKAEKPQSTVSTKKIFANVGNDLYDAVAGQLIAASTRINSSLLFDTGSGYSYRFCTNSGLLTYSISVGAFQEVSGASIKCIASITDDETINIAVGITSGGRLAYSTDGECLEWTTLATLNGVSLTGCSARLDGEIATVFAWNGTKLYKGQISISSIDDLAMSEYVDSGIQLGGASIRGVADKSIEYGIGIEGLGSSFMQLCTGDNSYQDQLILANNGIHFLDGIIRVRASGRMMSNTSFITKSSKGQIWVVGYESNPSYPRRLYNAMINDAAHLKLTTTTNIRSVAIGDGIASINLNGDVVQLGSVNRLTENIVVDSSVSGLKKISAIGKDGNTTIFGSTTSTGTNDVFEFDFFTIVKLDVSANTITGSLGGLKVKKLVKCSSSSNFNAICTETSGGNELYYLLEYKPLSSRTSYTTSRSWKIGGTASTTGLQWFCHLEDDGDQMILALRTGDDMLNYSYYDQMYEYENGHVVNPLAVSRANGKWVILCRDSIMIFNKHGTNTTYVIVQSSDSSCHWKLVQNGNKLLSVSSQRIEEIDKTGTAIILKAGLSSVRTIAAATFDDQVQRWFYVQGRDIYWSSNQRIWKKMFSLKDTTITTVYDIIVINKNIYVFATNKGIYSTRYSWIIEHDINSFGRDDALSLYNQTKIAYMDPKLDDTMAKHDQDDHGARNEGDPSIQLSSQLPLIAQLNQNFSSVDLDDLEPTWQQQTSTGQILNFRNDMIAEMAFGTYIDGNVIVYTSSFMDECEDAEEISECKDLSYIMKRWMSGITELYINIPSTGTKYLNNLYGAAGCRTLPEAQIDRSNMLNSPCGASQTGELSSHYTTIAVGIESAEYHVDQILGIEINGNSLPLDVYKDNSGNAGASRGFYSSFIEPSVARNWNVSTTDSEGNWIFNFACFGTDAQAIHLMFYDSKARTNAPYIKILFDSNGGEGEMPKQKFLLVGDDPEKYTLEQKPLKKNRFTNSTIGYEKIFAGWSLSPQADNYSGSDVLDGSQIYQNTQMFPTSVGFPELMAELGRGTGSGVEGLEKKEEITLYAVWITYKFSDSDTRFVMNSTKEKFKIASVGVDESTNLKGTVVIDFGD